MCTSPVSRRLQPPSRPAAIPALTPGRRPPSNRSGMWWSSAANHWIIQIKGYVI